MTDIRLFIGKAGTGRTHACFERIRDLLERGTTAPIILLVPDPATYVTERALAAYLPQKGFTTVRVVGFGRLAHQVFQSLGKERQETLSSVGRTLLLRYVMAQQADQLPLLGQAMRQPRFADVLQQLVKECQAFQVSVDDLRAGAEAVSSLVLQKKLKEIASVMEGYQDLVRTQFGEDVDPLVELGEAIPQSPIVQGAHVFVDGFHWLTPLREQVLHAIIRTAQSTVVTLTLPADSAERQKQARQGALFARPYELYQHLKDAYGTAIKEEVFVEPRRYPAGPMRALMEGYFASPMQPNPHDTGIHCTVAYHRERETDAVCRQILSFVEQGYRWKDMAIMLREEETYGTLLAQQLSRYGIPYFTDRRHPMVTHPLSELVTGLFQLITGSFDHDTVFRLLKTDLFPVTRTEVDILENYCLEFGLYRQVWLQDTWTAAREQRPTPDADPVVSEEEKARREAVNETHRRLLDVLRPWWDFAQTAHPAGVWCEELFQVLTRLAVPEILQTWTTQAAASGDKQEEAAHGQMYRKVLSLLDEIMRVATDQPLTAEDMMRLLEEGLREVTYSLVPPSLDHVTVTKVERGYTRENKIVFVLGLNEGVFPQRLGDEGLLKDTEREALRAAGITLAEGALIRAFNENFLLYMACTRATEHLYVSYAQSNEEGGALEPSLIIKRWEQLGYIREKEQAPLTIPEGKESAYMWRPAQTISLFASRAGLLSKGEPMAPIWGSFYNWALESDWKEGLGYATRGLLDTNIVAPLNPSVVQALLVKGKDLFGSVSSLEQYHKCPFSYLAKFGLRLENRKVRTFSAPEIGTFLHDSLYLLGKALLQSQLQWRDKEVWTLDRDCQRVVEELAADMGGDSGLTAEFILQFKQRLLDTLIRSVHRLREWSSRCEFNMEKLEQPFGMGQGSWPSVTIPVTESNMLHLRGRIDRIDTMRSEAGDPMALVIDYKTGGSKVSAGEIFFGLRLQLVTYLLALERSREGGQNPYQPAALVYSFVKNTEITSKRGLTAEEAETLAMHTKDGMKNQGYFVRDPEVLGHIDYKVTEGKATTYVPIRLTKKLDVHSSDVRYTKTPGEFHTLMRYTQKLLSKTGQQMLQGYFPVSPVIYDKINACQHCQYQTVCRFDKQRQSYRYLRKLEEDAALTRMEEGDCYEMDRRAAKRD